MIKVAQKPSDKVTGIFSRIRSVTLAPRKKLLPKSRRAYWLSISHSRSGADLSKPYWRLMSSISLGSRPRLARELACRVSTLAPGAPPPMPCKRAIACSTGPPGAAWTMTKLTSRMISKVGTISNSRRRMYAVMAAP
ncbi:hypothetical protein D3C75_992450 [compost metagenome]